MRRALLIMVALMAGGCGASPPRPPAAQAPRSLPDISVCAHVGVRAVAKALRARALSQRSSGESYNQAQCEYRVRRGRRVEIAGVGLDVASAAAQRLCNQQAERAQFHGGGDPDNSPQTIPRLGDDPYRAYWVASLGRLYATRTGRFLTVSYTAAARSAKSRRDAAIRVARLIFGGTTDLHPPAGKPPQASC